MATEDTFRTTIESQLDQWKAHMEAQRQKVHILKAKAETLDHEAKRQYLRQIQELEQKIENVQSKIDEGHNRLEHFKSTGQEAWQEMKAGGQSALGGMMGGVQKAWKEVKSSLSSDSSKDGNRKKRN